MKGLLDKVSFSRSEELSDLWRQQPVVTASESGAATAAHHPEIQTLSCFYSDRKQPERIIDVFRCSFNVSIGKVCHECEGRTQQQEISPPSAAAAL